MSDAPFHVVTCNLAPDLGSAAPAYRLSDFGALDEPQLVVVLELLRALDPAQNDRAGPHVLIEAPAGRFRVTTRQGRLFLHDARGAAKTGVELDAITIAGRLTQSPNAAEPLHPGRAGGRRRGFKAICALLGLVIVVTSYTLFVTLHSAPSVRPGPAGRAAP